MDKMKLSCQILLGLVCLAGPAICGWASPCPTTNDVNAVFDSESASPQFTMRAEAFGLCRRISSYGSNHESQIVGRYFLSRVVGFPISTNTPFATTSLREKALTISYAMTALAGMIDESDIQGILRQCMAVSQCPTNHFQNMLSAARKRDSDLNMRSDSVGQREAFVGNLPPHVRAARKEMSRIERWNVAVKEYQDVIVGEVIRFFEERWKDLSEEARHARIENMLKTLGSSMPCSTGR